MSGGSPKKLSDTDFIEAFRRGGAPEVQRLGGASTRNVMSRRRSIEREYGIALKSPNQHGPKIWQEVNIVQKRLQHEVRDGTVLIGSDSHYWPGVVTTAHSAFVKFARELKPAVIIKNGDELDFPAISRHPSIGWEERPKVVDEIECAKERLAEIEDASKNSKLYWPLGNHDARFETRLATVAPEYANVHGVHLKDHFPRWQPCWSVWLNDNVVVKHRFKGGMHATHNNTLWAGKTIITGHLHSLRVTPFSDYNGTRYGVDTGTLAEPYGPQFENYTEQNPLNWRSGFIVLTFHKGRLLVPEVAFVSGEGEVEFRGKVIHV